MWGVLLRNRWGVTGIAAVLACAGSVGAEEKPLISTDRPDFVESSVTVGPRNLQFESGVLFSTKTLDDGTERTVRSTPLTLRYGIGEKWEVRLETGGYSRREDTPPGETSSTKTGLADLTFGAKWNVLDHDPDRSARPSAAWLFNIETDTGTPEFRGDGLRPAVRFTMEWELSRNVWLGVMPGVASETDEGDRYAVGTLATVFGQTYGWRWGSFVEIALEKIASEKRENLGFADTGMIYRIKRNWQIDTALRWGITDDSPDFVWVFGLSGLF